MNKIHQSSYALLFFIVCMLTTSLSFSQNVTVAKDGTGDFTTVQAAINAAPTGRTAPWIIYIKNGKYKEKINVPSTKPFLQFLGQSVGNVILTFDDYSGKPIPGGGVHGTSSSASVTIRAADFTAINITFENTTGESPQALAIYVDGDRSAFKNCRFLGGQDTVFAGGNGARQYFKNCYIDGTVDFIFGDARAVFDSCVIYAKTRASAGASYITAANTKQTEPYGYVFRDSKIPANRGGTVYFLGRPWQNDAATLQAAKSWNKTVFINTTMSASIQPAGWSTWDAGTDVTQITYAEYRSKKFDSSLVDISSRTAWSKQLTATEAAAYNNANLFGSWDPCTVATGFCNYTPEPIAVSNFKGVKGAATSSFTWNISWPIAGIKYEVLRSSNAVTFTKVSEQTSINDSTVNFSYSEAIPPPGNTYYYLIQASKAGYATHISDTVTISSTPTITVTGAMGSFVQGVGIPSTSQTYIVSGASLTNSLIITPPAPYELSLNGSAWNNVSSPIVLTPDGNGNVVNTTIFVRLNANAAGTYNGFISHASVGADSVKPTVSGTVQSAPLAVSEIIQWWPMAVSNTDSASVRSIGAIASAPTFSRLVLSNGTTVASVPAYSPTHGQGFGASVNGDGTWSTAVGGPGSNPTRVHFEEFKITAAGTHSLRVDSLIFNTVIQNSANGRLAIAWSRSAFTTDSTEVTDFTFATPKVLINETGGNSVTNRIAFAGGTGINLTSGQILTFRLYYGVGSSSSGRYAKLKEVQLKGLSTPNPTTGDYRTKQTGDWTDLATWERWDGSAWVTPAPAYPVYNNANTTTILAGHTVTISATLPNGSGYIGRTTVANSGQLIVNNGAALSIANDGLPSTATADLRIDGTFTNFGSLGTNGNVSVFVNGNFVHSGTGINWSNAGDTVIVGAVGIYQHNANSNSTPARLLSAPGGTLLITGITTNQTGIFKNTSKYGNIVWNNAGQLNYYAFRLTLDSVNVQGSFTVQSTGNTYIAFANTTGRVALPGGYFQTGGTVNFRESGTIIDTLDVGGDFSVTGGSFISNMGTGTSLLVRLNGINKSINYAQSTATNTDWLVNGLYTVASNMVLPSAAFGVIVNGTLNTGINAISGAGKCTVNAAASLSSGAPLGINGNVTAAGVKVFSTAANYIFNGTAAQVTGSLLPTSVNTLIINNAADVSLSGSVNVTNALTLTAGKLILGANNLSASSVLSSTSVKYLVTDNVGTLKINNIGAGNNVFPVGPGVANYNPVVIDNSGTIDNYSVRVQSSFTNAVPNATLVVNRQWTIAEDVPGGSNAKLSFSWIAADQAAGFNPASAISIIRYNGATWESFPATITGVGTTVSPYVASASGIPSVGVFTVTNDGALPLQMLSFKAAYINKLVAVNWTTTNEVNTKYFEVERSADGNNFVVIGKVNAANRQGNHQYSMSDASPATGINYYRLKSVDLNGSFSISAVVAVAVAKKGNFSIVGNPLQSQLVVNHAPALENTWFRIVSTDGKVLFSTKMAVGSTRSSFNVSALRSGMYLLVCETGESTSAVYFLKQ